jgi:hypothetical protein
MSFAPALAGSQPVPSPSTGPATRPQYEVVGAGTADLAVVIGRVMRFLGATPSQVLMGALIATYNGGSQIDVVPDSTTQTDTTLHVGDRNAKGGAVAEYGFNIHANGNFSSLQAIVADVLQTIWFGGAFVMKLKAGVPVDGDFPAVQDGMTVLDTTDLRIYFRSGGAWHYAALT